MIRVAMALSSLVRLLGVAALTFAAGASPAPAEVKKLSEEVIPYKGDTLPARTRPLLEVGPALLGTGPLDPGIELPTGAVWQPALWVFGQYRTAVDIYKNGDAPEVQEWANRLDLFANLRLSGTERVLIGLSPLRDGTRFSGYHRRPESQQGFDDEFSGEPTALFFEGEIGEIFPEADPFDTGGLDLGFTVGRQQLLFQEGLLINDTVDAVALTRDTVITRGLSVDTRLTALFGWGNIHRSDNRRDDEAQLFGAFTETDLRSSTVAADAIFVTGGNDAGAGTDGAFLGIGSTQRIGKLNTAFRLAQSIALDESSAAVDTGTLALAELSGDPLGNDDVLYLNGAWAAGRFTSAARDPLVGGPLGPVGILFASAGLGDYGVALNNRAEDVAAAALGYQMFFNEERTQVVAELGARVGTDGEQRDAAALGLRLQQALGDRYVVQLDGFVSREEARDVGYGARTEFLVRF
ncbi:MAG: hypothetical protein RLO51_09895 [Thalassobaculum sp.]|uniref:hypothetical protein n=1 Tax=Thalassobaculum sp. TaxID=2022740 RepID=UPI0032EFF877